MSALRIDRLPFFDGPGADPKVSVSRHENRGASFSELLGKATQPPVPGPVAGMNHGASLSKTEIIRMAESIHRHMNTHLMQALAGDTGEKNDTPARIDVGQFIPYGMPSSNNYPLNQNNDVATGNNKYESIINDAAGTYGVDAALVRSIVNAESGFDSNATSPKGAMGLMQLMPETARELGVRNAYDPVENIRAGTRYLKTLLNRYDGNVSLALAAYNWGMGNLEKRPGQMPSETRQYVAKVTDQYEKMKV